MNRSTRNNVYDLITTSFYMLGLSIIGIFIVTICKLIYIIWSY